MGAKEVFFKNPPAGLLVINPPKFSAGKEFSMSMNAKKRKRGKKRVKRTHKKRHYSRKHSKRGRRSRPLHTIRISGNPRRHRRNPRRGGRTVGKFFRLPTMSEMLWLGGTAIALPTVSRMINQFLPASFQTGWGRLGSEFVIGSVGSVLVKRFVSEQAGNAVFTVMLVTVLPKVVGQLTGGMIGTLGEGESLSYLDPSNLAYMDPNQTGLSGDNEPLGM